MGRTSTVDGLPADIKIEVRRRLRGGEASQIAIVDWLNNEGFSVTKSALNRYAIRLERADQKAGVDRFGLSVRHADITALFEELAILRARESEVLAQIEAVTIPKTLATQE